MTEVLYPAMEEAKAEGPEEFGERLKAALKAKGWTQSKLSLEIDVEPPRLSVWIKGTIKPTYYAIKAIAIALGVPAGYLLGLEDLPDDI